MNYDVRNQEGLAMVDTFKKFEHYLLGSKFTIILRTDHTSLTNLSNGAPLKGRLGRWREYLGGFDYQIIAIKGTKNLWGDGLSRSITMHTAQNAEVINAPIEKVEAITDGSYVTRVGAMHLATDARFGELDYTACPDFKEVIEELATNDLDTMNESHPHLRYYSRVDDRLYHWLVDD